MYPHWGDPLWFDRKGKPIDAATYDRLKHDDAYKVVAQDWVEDWWISTVWLGDNYDFDSGSGPLIFETMIFLPGEGGDLLLGGRYPTEEVARAGHSQALDALQDERVRNILAAHLAAINDDFRDQPADGDCATKDP
jgi:hypothetical protein